MERGLLTGKYFKQARLKADDHRNGYFSQFDTEKVKTLIGTLEALAQEKNSTVSQLVLRWTTTQPAISVVLAGARNAQQAAENARAMDISLSQDELNIINTLLGTL